MCKLYPYAILQTLVWVLCSKYGQKVEMDHNQRNWTEYLKLSSSSCCSIKPSATNIQGKDQISN